MDNVKNRLQETVQNCMDIYDKWSKDPKNSEMRQQMEESVHELRKVTSRIEIELAIADRSNSSQKRMPIPPHRSAKPKGGRRQNGHDGNNEGGSGNNGNDSSDGGQGQGGGDDKPKRGRRPKLKSVSAKNNTDD